MSLDGKSLLSAGVFANYVLDQGARVFSHIGYHFEVIINWELIFNIPRISWHRKEMLDIYSWFNGDLEHLNVSPS